MSCLALLAQVFLPLKMGLIGGHFMTAVLVIYMYIMYVSFAVTASEYYIRPKAGGLCPSGQTCHTIDDIADQPEVFLSSNTALYFMEGAHILEQRQLVSVDNVSNITLKGLGSLEQGFHETVTLSTVVVQCVNASGGLAFIGSKDISVKGIMFKDCGADAAKVDTYYNDFCASLVFSYVTNVTLEYVSILNGTGMGLICSNCLDLFISNSSFAKNHIPPDCGHFLCAGGNVYILFHNSLGPFSYLNDSVFSIEIVQSNFSFGVSAYYGIAGGLTISKASSSNDFYDIDILLDTVILYNNAAVNGPNLYVSFSTTQIVSYSILVVNTISTYGQPHYVSSIPVSVNGGGMFFLDQAPEHVQGSIAIKRSQFINNYVSSYGGMSLGWVGGVVGVSLDITDTVFRNNSGSIGSGLYVYASGSLVEPSPPVTLTNISIIDNRAVESGDPLLGAANFQNLNVRAEQLHIIGNLVTGIVSLATVMTFSGYNSFVCNAGYNGGALALYESSFILLQGGTNVSFIENIAYDRGGAIYASQMVHIGVVPSLCFFQLASAQEQDVELYFRGNGAEIAGNVLYGGDVDKCSSNIRFHDLFNYAAETEPTQVSSDPSQVCFCDGNQPNCEQRYKTVSVSPGEAFSVHLVGAGQFDGGTPAVLQLTDYTNRFPQSYLSNIIAQCDASPTTFTIRIDNASLTTSQVYFTLQGVVRPMDNEYAKVLNITILPCPIGFSLNPSTGLCECEGVLMNIAGVVCDVTTQEMSRSGNIWMGYLNNSNCTIVREDCPFDYCNTSNITFHIQSPEPQCALNRAGIMCGECREGYSLLLGSNKCAMCSDAYISLVLLFGLAGVALVAFLFALDMTISSGTINGLILYANLVKINEDAFLPDGPIPVLSQFIAWINLDFGIEVCFFDRMTAITKAWLFYAFPLYIWLLMILLVVVAEWSQKVAKLLGNNIIPVLGTLILLSITKIYRAALNAMSGTMFVCNSDTRTVWYIDPNVDYNNPEHLSLAILSLLLIILTLPYVLSLLLSYFTVQWLQRLTCGCNHLRLGIRTFIDAYNAPYKNAYTTFWTGLTLLVRIASVLSVAFSALTISTTVVSILTALLLALMAVMKGIYKNYVNLLEVWFLLHVLVVTIFTFYGLAQVVTALSIALALLTFLGIITYHAVILIQRTNKGAKLKGMMIMTSDRFKHRKSALTSDDTNGVNRLSEKDFVHTTSIDIAVLRRRETLLDDTSSSYIVSNSGASSNYHLAD